MPIHLALLSMAIDVITVCDSEFFLIRCLNENSNKICFTILTHTVSAAWVNTLMPSLAIPSLKFDHIGNSLQMQWVVGGHMYKISGNSFSKFQLNNVVNARYLINLLLFLAAFQLLHVRRVENSTHVELIGYIGLGGIVLPIEHVLFYMNHTGPEAIAIQLQEVIPQQHYIKGKCESFITAITDKFVFG